MGRPKFTLMSDSEEDDRNSQSSDNCTEATFNQTLQTKFVEIRKRNRQQAARQQAAHISDEGSAEEEVKEVSGRSSEEESESEGEQTTKRFVIKTRKQTKRKQLIEEVGSEEEKPKKKAKKQMKKAVKKEEQTETKKAKIEWKQQKCTLSAFWRMVNGHKDRIPDRTKEILMGTNFGEMMEPFWQDKITEIQLHKHEADLEILLRHFDRTDNKWKFGDIVMEITEEDVTALFHIPAEGEVFNVNRRVVREDMEDSPIFGSPLKTQAVLRTRVESTLIDELTKPAEEKDARKIAVLMMTYLFSTFFFTRTGAQITWDMVAICERIETINMYNWPRLILNFLMEGLQKYRRNSPSVLNGCLLLIYYWFLEKTKAKTWIPGRENETPRFIRWSIKEIFSLEQLYMNENLAVDLIKAGPWSTKIRLEDIELGEEVQDTPSFDNWVPLASQAEEQQNERLTGNIKELIREMEEAIGETKPAKEMEVKLARLAKANEDLTAQNKDLWGKLRVADERIRELEIEKRAKNNLIRALYIRLESEKGEVPPPQTQLEIVPFKQVVVHHDEVEDENPNFGPSVGEETHHAASAGKSTDTVKSAFPIAQEVPEEVNESSFPLGPQKHGNEDEDAQLDNIIRNIAEAEVMQLVRKEKKKERKHADEEQTKKTPEIHSIVKNVKTYKRAAKKAREEEWEYDTPEEAKISKRAAPKKAGVMLQATGKFHNKLKLKGVKCDKQTWKTLDPAVARYYRDFFNVAQKDTTEYWISSDLLRRITKHDLRVIIQEGDIETDVIAVYIDLLKSDAEKQSSQVGFLTVDASYYAIKYEQTKEQEEDTRPFECGVETMIYEPLWSVFRFKQVLLPIHHITSMHYTLLVIDNETRRFSHMNSLRPPVDEFNNEEKYHLNAARVVKHIKKFIHAVNLTKMRMPGESQDPNVTREKCTGEDDNENLIIVEEAMTEEEKQTRNWILQNNVAETDYELYEDFDCPQQNPSSGDCGPFMLHYMESIVNGVEPTKEGGDNMRKRLLERFMHLVLGRK